MIVEKVSGKPFGQFLHDRIFDPLKMDNTLAYEKGKNDVPARVFGVQRERHLARNRSESDFRGSWRWRHLLFGRRSGEVGPIPTPPYVASAAEMEPALTAVKPTAISSLEATNISYSFGWFLSPHKSHPAHVA